MKDQNRRFLFLLPLFAFINFSIVKATAQTLLAEVRTPWYGSWWMWAGIILFIIVLTGLGNIGRR